jgi:GTP pyrophosphokinase
MVNSNNKVITFDDVVSLAKTYINDENIILITKAYNFANEAHKGQMRKSGEPFIMHLVNVAYILTDLQVSPYTIIAGFLHDTIEDCGVSKETIAKEFNKEISELVESVTKVTQLSAMTKEEFQAENHRKIFIAMAKDIRVILIKLADRVHNMRTLFAQSIEKQKLIARETLDVYSPIAHRLGINTIKSELDDLSLKYLEPEKYRNIITMLAKKESERNNQLKVMSDKIINLLGEHKIPFRISGRIKNLYSIYKKVYLKERVFE